MPVTAELEDELEAFAHGAGRARLPGLGRHRELRDAGRARPVLDRPEDPRHRPGHRRPSERPRHRRRHHRRHRRRRHRGRRRSRPRATRSSGSTSRSRAGSSTRRRRSGRRRSRRPARRSRRSTPSELQAVGITNQRETILLWDRETLGSPRRAIVWQDRRTADICTRLQGRGPRGAGRRADRAAAGPVLLRHQADVAGRAGAAHLGAGRVGAVRRRHRRLLPDRPDDPRDLPRHRRLQRLPDAALRPQHRRLVRRAVRAVRRTPRRAARAGPQLGRGRDHRPDVVPRPVAADRRDRRRPAVGAVRADLLRPGRRQVHLRHRVVHPHQHRHRTSSARTPGCCRRPRGARRPAS